MTAWSVHENLSLGRVKLFEEILNSVPLARLLQLPLDLAESQSRHHLARPQRLINLKVLGGPSPFFLASLLASLLNTLRHDREDFR
jgi:hypothetical protein